MYDIANQLRALIVTGYNTQSPGVVIDVAVHDRVYVLWTNLHTETAGNAYKSQKLFIAGPTARFVQVILDSLDFVTFAICPMIFHLKIVPVKVLIACVLNQYNYFPSHLGNCWIQTSSFIDIARIAIDESVDFLFKCFSSPPTWSFCVILLNVHNEKLVRVGRLDNRSPPAERRLSWHLSDRHRDE